MTLQLDIDFDRELTREERQILGMLKPGRENALQVALLASYIGVEDRRLRQIVKHLVEDHGACIGSTTRQPAGYYIINDPQELADAYDRLRRRGISILHRAARIKKTSVTEVFGQGEL